MAYKIFSANDVKAAAVDVAADSFAIIDANDSNKTRKESVADLITAVAGSGLSASSGVLAVDLGEVTAATVDVSADHFLFLDGSATGATKKDSIADLMTAVAGTGLSASSGALSVDASQAQITTLAGLTAAGANGSSLTLTYDAMKLQSADANEPAFTLENTNADANGPVLKLNKNGTSVADNDIAGSILFSSEDDASNATDYAKIVGGVLDATSGEEQGALSFWVAEYDGSATMGLEMKGLATDGDITVDVKTHDGSAGGLMLGGYLVTSTAAELNLIDGSSAGTVVNSKAAVYGSSGELNATTLQIAGTSITATAAELNIMDGVTSTAAELNILDGVTSTAAELNILDGVTATAAELNIMDGNATVNNSVTVADGDGLVFNDAGTMKQLDVRALAAYMDDEITSMPNLVASGALNSGSISSGFGNIDNGSSTLDTGVATVASMVCTAGATFGGGYGSTGVTISTAGVLQADGAGTFGGALTCATSLTIGSAAMSEADLEQLDGITAGTAAASKALVLDANKDIGTIRNLTIDGVFTDGNYTFDTSGNVSGLGTVASGAISSSGIVLTSDATDASSTTAAALKSAGGLAVVKSAIVGKMLACQAISVSGVVAKSANFTVDSASGTYDGVILCDSSSSAFTITLPAVTPGRRVVIKDSAGSAATNAISIATPGSETIDGASSFDIEVNYAAVTCMSDGTNWFIM